MDETIHPETLEETTPPVILDAWSQGSAYLAHYGWYLVGFGVVAAYGWTRVSPYFYEWRKKQEEKAYDAKYKKDPNISKARTEAYRASRKRMQEVYEKEAAEWAEKMKEIEAKKREDELEKLKNVPVGRTWGESSSSDSSKTKFKRDQSRKKQEEEAYNAKYIVDPNVAKAQMEASRKRIQDEYEKKAAEWTEKMREIEAKKQEEKLEKTKNVPVGCTWGESSSSDSNKTKFKPDQSRKKQEEEAYDAKFINDLNVCKAEMEASRKRMQEEYEKKAAEWAEKMKEIEAKKREEELEKTENVPVSRTLGESSSSDSNKTNYKPGYFPLAGSGGTGYRPPRRSCCPNSGCG